MVNGKIKTVCHETLWLVDTTALGIATSLTAINDMAGMAVTTMTLRSVGQIHRCGLRRI
jgi:hypothetical protein